MYARTWPWRSARSSGFTLLELMISIAIGLVILGALSFLYVGSRGAYRVNESLARVQETGRLALDFLQEDGRASGFLGCRSRNVPNVNVLMIARPAVTFAGTGDAVRGFEDGAGWVNPTTITRVRGDVLTLRRAIGIGDEIAANTDVAGAKVTLKNNCSGMRQSDYVALGSCDRMVVLRVTNTPSQTCSAAMAPVVIEHAATGSVGGNGNNGVVSGSDSHKILTQFNIDSRATAYRFDEISFFIGQNPGGRPSLYRTSINGAAEELVENVEDLDLVFGIDTSAPADGIADSYVRADGVTNWSQAISVRVSVVVTGPEANVLTQAQTYNFGTTASGTVQSVSATDTRLRQVFATTITLRNRLP